MRSFALAGLALALVACRGSEAPAPSAPPPPSPELLARAAAPATVEPGDVALDADHVMRAPVVDGRVTLVPIVALAPARDTRNYVLLTDAMNRGTASVKEMPEDWVVEKGMVHNASNRPVLALRGELMLDGFQDRVLAENKVIEPGAREEIALRCVESERSSGESRTFRAGGVIAELSIRRAVRWADQSTVWRTVNQINERLGLDPGTETYRHAAARQYDAASRARLERVVTELAKVEGRDAMVGVAVAVDGRVIAIEKLRTPALWRAAEPRLLASYLAVTDVDPPQGKAPSTVSPYAVRALAAWEGATSTTEVSTEVLRPIDLTPQD
jgi:hypothetical protein